MTPELVIRHAENAGTAPRPNGPARILIRLARWARRRSAFHNGEGAQRTTNAVAYSEWRAASLRCQMESHFSPDQLADRDVLDFGCGGGELSGMLIRDWACRGVVGSDPSASAVRAATGARERLSDGERRSLRFIQSAADGRIDLPDNSFDVVCCFDVVEHVADIVAAASEWRRLLRPGGQVWIWWSPWRGPYGHHLESLLPLPWVHLWFAPATLFRACAEIYDDPAFVPRIWDCDPATGVRRPNKWRATKSFKPFLNRLTRRGFESAVSRAGLTIAERRAHGFSGSVAARATRPLTRLPGVGECFVSFYTYRLLRGWSG